MRVRSFTLTSLLAVALVAAACGSDGGGDASPSSTSGGSATTVASGPGLPCKGGTPASELTPAAQPLATPADVTIVAGAKVESLLVPFLTDHLGEFERENLDVEFQILPPADAMSLIATDRADLMVGGLGAGEMNAMSGGADMRWIANAHGQSAQSEEGLWVSNDLLGPDGKPDPAKVRGARIALSASSAASVASVPTAKWLESIGLSLDDVELVNLPATEILLALENGALGAGYLVTPFWQSAKGGDFATLVTPQPPLAASGYLLAGEHLKGDRTVADAIVRAMSRTIEACLQGDYHADPAAMAAIVEVLGQPKEVIAGSPSLVFDPALGFDTELLGDLQEVWIGADVLQYDQPKPASAFVDETVVTGALG